MYRYKSFILITVVFSLVLFTFSLSLAEDYFEVRDLVIPPSLKTEGASFEPSAVAVWGDKLIILNDEPEEGKMYFYITDKDGNIIDKKLIDAGREISDFEAITCTGEAGAFYLHLSTSYGREFTKGLFKLVITDEDYTITTVPHISDGEELPQNIIYDCFNRVLHADELNLEGLGYYKGKYNEYLFVGAREPLISNETGVWRLDFEDIKAGNVITPTLWFSFEACPGTPRHQGISSLEYYPDRSLMFILTVYETEEEMGGALWIAKSEDPEDYNVEIPRYPAYQWKGVKPEGLTIIENEDGKESLFIVFDNDEERTGIPGQFTILPLDKIYVD